MTIILNPPPKDGKCAICRKVKPLRKNFRAHLRGTDNEYVDASWECKDCWN